MDKCICIIVVEGHKLESQCLPPPQFMHSNVSLNPQIGPYFFQALDHLLSQELIVLVPASERLHG